MLKKKKETQMTTHSVYLTQKIIDACKTVSSQNICWIIIREYEWGCCGGIQSIRPKTSG